MLFLGTVLLTSCGQMAPAGNAPSDSATAAVREIEKSSPGQPGRRLPGEAFFADPAVHIFKLQVNQEGLNSLRQNPREFVPATVQAGQVTYTNVAIHLKGTLGSFRNLNEKPAFTLNFSKFSPGQKFHGLRSIHLNNSVQDGTRMCEYLSGELFRAAGVPATRVSFAQVELNGRKLGLYVLKEGFSKDFLSIYFQRTRGNLYDNDPGKEITARLEKDSGDGPDDWSDLKRLSAATRESDPDKLWGPIERGPGC